MGWTGDANGETLVSARDTAVEERTPAIRPAKAKPRRADVRNFRAMIPAPPSICIHVAYKDGGGMKPPGSPFKELGEFQRRTVLQIGIDNLDACRRAVDQPRTLIRLSIC
jgi:hypothetical protein